VDVRVRSGFEVLPTPQRQDAAAAFTLEENHLGHPRFARMTSQGSELRPAGSIRLSFLVTDLAVSIVNLFLVSYVREAFTWLPASLGSLVARHPYIGTKGEFLALLMLYSALTILSCRTFGLYDTREPRPLVERGWAMLEAITLSTGLLAIFAWVSRLAMMSPLVMTGAGVLNLIGFTGWRLWHRHSSTRRVMEKKQARNVLIIGGDHVANRVADALHRNPHLGYAVAGLVKINGNGNGNSNGNGHSNGNGNGNGNGHGYDEAVAQGSTLTLDSLDELSRIARAHFVDEILIAPPVSQELVRQVLSQAHRNRLDVKIVPELYQEIALHSLTDFMGGIPVMSLHREPIPENKLFIKRVVDVVVSSIALLMASPVLAVIAIAIKLDSRGPAFYCAPRVGKKGRKFTFYKFRTMVVDAEAQKERLRALNERSGPFFKIQNDPRITRVGYWLRKFSLDELPQLWNVLKGDMSMVGPRPHPLDDFAQYQLEDLRRLDVMPGITGLWQVSARKDPSFDKNLALDLEYIDNWSPLQDFKILLQTVPAVLRAHGE